MNPIQAANIAALDAMYASGDYDPDSVEYKEAVRRVFGPLESLNLCNDCHREAQTQILQTGAIQPLGLPHRRLNCQTDGSPFLENQII